MRKHEKHGLHMTGPSADAAASCGDDTLSQKNKLEKEETHAGSENRRRADLYTTRSCAADGDISAKVCATPTNAWGSP